jgi:alkylation response protein AidB-like acyl-CoA dehydrogenase
VSAAVSPLTAAERDPQSPPTRPAPRRLSPAGALDRASAVAAEIATRADAHDRDGSLPARSIASLWEAGLGNLTLAAEHGGEGADLLSASRAVRLVGAGDGATALIWVMHLIHLKLIADVGLAGHVRDRVIASSLRGPALINALRVEPELGTPSRGGVPATKAVRGTGSDGQPAWLLRGHKIYCTGSHGLRWLMVWAATASDDPDGVRIGPFLVRRRPRHSSSARDRDPKDVGPPGDARFR